MDASKILFMGSPEWALPSLKALLESGHPVVGVVTQPDRPAGRGQEVTPCAVAAYARASGLPLLQPEKIDDPFLGEVKKINADLAIVVAYGRILPRSFLQLFPNRCWNVHFSLLPKYRGAAPVQWALLNDEPETGVTTMLIQERLDAGPILMQKKIVISEEDTASTLGTRLANAGGHLLRETLEALENDELAPQPQNEREATLAPSFQKEDGRLDWSRKAKMLWCQVRAMNPWPGAWTLLDGKRLKIHHAEALSRKTTEPPGTVISTGAKGNLPKGIEIACGHDVLLVDELQLEGKKKMDASDFLQGYPLAEGKQLGN